MNADQWSQNWGDNFPTEKECPMDVIAHHVKCYGFELTQEMIGFARAMWNEGNLMEKLS